MIICLCEWLFVIIDVFDVKKCFFVVIYFRKEIFFC